MTNPSLSVEMIPSGHPGSTEVNRRKQDARTAGKSPSGFVARLGGACGVNIEVPHRPDGRREHNQGSRRYCSEGTGSPY